MPGEDPKTNSHPNSKPKWTLPDRGISEAEQRRRFQVWRKKVLVKIREANQWKFAGSA